MSELSEKEIDKKIQDLIHKLEKMMSTSTEFIGTDIKVSMSEDDKKVLLDLISLCLDLNRECNTEKEKNKILSIQIIENGKLYDKETARLGNLIRELLEERNNTNE